MLTPMHMSIATSAKSSEPLTVAMRHRHMVEKKTWLGSCMEEGWQATLIGIDTSCSRGEVPIGSASWQWRPPPPAPPPDDGQKTGGAAVAVAMTATTK